jgi:hypothetical protein
MLYLMAVEWSANNLRNIINNVFSTIIYYQCRFKFSDCYSNSHLKNYSCIVFTIRTYHSELYILRINYLCSSLLLYLLC